MTLQHFLVPSHNTKAKEKLQGSESNLTIAESSKPEMPRTAREISQIEPGALMSKDHHFHVLSLEKILGGVGTMDTTEVFHMPNGIGPQSLRLKG